MLDTNVLVSGLMLPESVPGRIVAAWRGAHFELALSEPLLDEIGRVLSYPKISARLGWGKEEIDHFLLLLRFKTDVVDIAEGKANGPQQRHVAITWQRNGDTSATISYHPNQFASAVPPKPSLYSY